MGGGVAVVASVLGRPQTAAAADGSPVLQGSINVATTTTEVRTSGGTALRGQATDLIGQTRGVRGDSSSDQGQGVLGYATSATGTTYGVAGQSDSLIGAGVFGYAAHSTGNCVGVQGLTNSTKGIGVRGDSNISAGSTFGVVGRSFSPDGVGTAGQSWADGTGLQGWSGSSPGGPPAAPAKTGVFGYAVQDANAHGVHGQSTAGRGVFGQATTGAGVYASATTGIAIQASTPVSNGIHTGYALRASGKIKLDNCAGVATIAAGTNNVTVTPGLDLTAIVSCRRDPPRLSRRDDDRATLHREHDHQQVHDLPDGQQHQHRQGRLARLRISRWMASVFASPAVIRLARRGDPGSRAPDLALEAVDRAG